MVPFTPGKQHFVEFQFPTEQLLTGMKLWNYNKSPDDAFRGVREVQLKFDNQTVIPYLLLKRAPGTADYDFGQYFPLPPTPDYFQTQDIPKPVPINGRLCEYELANYPVGYDFRIELLETQGDIHYIGLNGVDIYDTKGKSILKHNPPTIGGSPASIRMIKGMENDSRTLENLLDSVNETYEDTHMWLAPFVNRYFDNEKQKNEKLNYIFLGFSKPVIVGGISIWNYSKDPNRGAKQIGVYLDDNLIYKVILLFLSSLGLPQEGYQKDRVQGERKHE